MVTSVTSHAATRSGVSELVRVWEPTEQPLADLVLVHGLGEHSGRYERTGGLLAEARIRTTSFDLVGFGASGGGRGDIESWTVYLDQVQDHLTEARTERPMVLMGHSMGGLIALEYALSERPQSDLAVLSAPALFGGRAWQRAVAPIAARIAPKLSIPNGLSGDQLSRDPAVGEAYFSDPLVLTKSTTRLGSELFAAMQRASTNLDTLSIPTMVVHGGADTIAPASCSAVLGQLSTVERTLYPKLRHETMNEPEGPEVVADIVAWIGRAITSAD